MHFNVSFRNTRNSALIRAYAERQISKSVKSNLSEPINVDMVFTRYDSDFEFSCAIQAKHGVEYKSEYMGVDIQDSIDRVVNELSQMARVGREKDRCYADNTLHVDRYDKIPASKEDEWYESYRDLTYDRVDENIDINQLR